MPPPIPTITDPDLIAAVSALARAGETYRKAFFLLAGRLLKAGGGDNEDFRHVLAQCENLLNLADDVINAWKYQLGHEDEDAEGV